jgi:DNA-binding beta-propeller fold protein YncE
MPHSVTPCSDGGVIVTDVGLHQVIKLDANGTHEWALGQERNPSGAKDCFSLPTDVAMAKDGSFYVSDGYGNARVLKFSSDNVLEKTWGSRGQGEGEFFLPHSVDLSDDGLVYVADRENSRIQVFDDEGAYKSQFQSEEVGKPFAVRRQGNTLYVADCGFPTDQRAAIVTIDLSTNSIHRFGKFGQAPGDLLGPHGIAVDAAGAVYVADAVLGLLKFTPEGNSDA